MCIRDRGSFHRHGHCQRLQRPTFMDCYGFNSAPTVRENHTVTGSHSGRSNIAIPEQLSRFIGPSAFTSAPITPPRMPRRHRLGLGAPYRSLHHPFPQRSWPYQEHRLACTLHAFTVRQLRIREPATPRDRELSSRGIIAFSLPTLSFSPRCRR